MIIFSLLRSARKSLRSSAIDESEKCGSARRETQSLQSLPNFRSMHIFDALPDAVASDVFKTLGLQESWPLRGVCRRWRRVVEETEWASFDLRISGEASSAGQSSEIARCKAAASLFEERKLRLSGGASVALRILRQLSPFELTGRSLLAAIAQSHSGPAQPRAVTVEVRGDRCDHEDEPVFGFLLHVLEALRPAAAHADPAASASASGSCSDLESLHVGVFCIKGQKAARMRSSVPRASTSTPSSSRHYYVHSSSTAPAVAARLKAALAPFAALRSLSFVFDSEFTEVEPEAAEVIAAACPLLRSVAISLRAYRERRDGALAAFASLAHLEHLAVAWPADRGGPVGLDLALATLADGPAGRSLRSLAFLADKRMSRPGEFPSRSPGSDPLFARLSGASLTALGRLPHLESVGPLLLDCAYLAPEDFRAFGRLAGLREAQLYFSGAEGEPARTAAALGALGEALSGLPRLERLRLKLDAPISLSMLICVVLASAGFYAPPEAVPAFLGSLGPAARRALGELSVGLDRPLSEADAGAVAALPALKRLRVSSLLEAPHDLRPHEVGRLRLVCA
eukprot:tig00000269_g23695.t1